MKKTWHTIFLILLICLDAALLLLPLLPGYRALFDIGPYPGRPPAFRFLKLAGYALFFPLTAYGCGRLLARIRKPRLRWLPAAVCLPQAVSASRSTAVSSAAACLRWGMGSSSLVMVFSQTFYIKIRRNTTLGCKIQM